MLVGKILSGLTLAASVGTIAYAVAKSTHRERRVLRRDASRTARAISDVVADFTSMLR